MPLLYVPFRLVQLVPEVAAIVPIAGIEVQQLFKGTEDTRKAIEAHSEKRDPVFRGR